MFSLILYLLVGLAAGYAASRVMDSDLSLLGMLAVGVVGSIIGGVLFGLIGFHAFGIIAKFVSAAVGAILLIWLVRRYNIDLPL